MLISIRVSSGRDRKSVANFRFAIRFIIELLLSPSLPDSMIIFICIFIFWAVVVIPDACVCVCVSFSL